MGFDRRAPAFTAAGGRAPRSSASQALRSPQCNTRTFGDAACVRPASRPLPRRQRGGRRSLGSAALRARGGASAGPESAEPPAAQSLELSAQESSLPDSMEDAMVRARAALGRAMEQGYRRVIIEVDLSLGDETYTILKRSMPMVQQFVRAVGQNGEGVRVVFPDAGTAAMMNSAWSDLSELKIVGIERDEVDDDDKLVVVVVPRAPEVAKLSQLLDTASPLFKDSARPFVLFNPDVVDMGATGLGLSARKLRDGVLKTFETIFYVRSLPWGCVYRNYPGRWTVWKEDAQADGGYRILDALPSRPTYEQLDEVLQASQPSGKKRAGGGPLASLRRFLSVYMKG